MHPSINQVYIVDSVFDIATGNPKNERIWGTRRMLAMLYSNTPPYIVGFHAYLTYESNPDMARTLAPLQAYYEDDEQLILVTLNSVYVLTKVGPKQENNITYICSHRISWFYRDEWDIPVPKELPDSEVEHIKEMICNDYVQGELCYTYYHNEKEYEFRGWWSIER